MSAKTFLFLLANIFLIHFIRTKAILLSVFEINRHGARTPKHFEERQKKLFFGSQNMQLTINGFRQEQILGSFIREKYVEKLKFLSADYKPEEFCLISSPTQRTIFSAAGFLSGLYPNYVVKNKYININKENNNNIYNRDKNGVNSENENNYNNNNDNNINVSSTKNINNTSNNINEIKENNSAEIIKTEKKLMENNQEINLSEQPIINNNNHKNKNKLRNLNGERKRLFANLPDTSDKQQDNNNNNNNLNNLGNLIKSDKNNIKTNKLNNYSLEILNLKNEDSIPQLHEFTELEKKAVSFLSLERKEIPLYIDNPLNDRLFHAWKCYYRGKPLLENLKNLNPIFDITENEILLALADFENFLKFNENDYYPDKKYKNKKDKLLALVKYYMSYIYHFKLNTDSKLNKETCKTFKKFIINDWYSVLNSKNANELKIPISEFFDALLKHFKNGIKFHKKTLKNDLNESKNKEKDKQNDNEDIEVNESFQGNDVMDKYVKFRVYSGHDTILINMLRGILDSVYIKDNLKRSLEDDNIFQFFVPEFGSYLIFELYYDDQGKYYFVKIIYNGMSIYDGIKIISYLEEKEEKYMNEIRFERFEELLHYNINKEYASLDCNWEGDFK